MSVARYRLILLSSLAVMTVIVLPFLFATPAAESGAGLEPPSLSKPFGVSPYGRPLLQTALQAAARSSYDALIATVLTLLVAAVVGSLAGAYPSGWIDRGQGFVARLLDSLGIFIPTAALMSVSREISATALSAFLALLAWPNLAQLIRAECVRLRSRPDTEVAWVLKVSPARLAWYYVTIPIVASISGPLAAVYASFIAVFGALDYFGLGYGGGSTSIGFMVFDSTENFLYSAPWYAAAAAFALFVALVPAAVLSAAIVPRDPRG